LFFEINSSLPLGSFVFQLIFQIITQIVFQNIFDSLFFISFSFIVEILLIFHILEFKIAHLHVVGILELLDRKVKAVRGSALLT